MPGLRELFSVSFRKEKHGEIVDGQSRSRLRKKNTLVSQTSSNIDLPQESLAAEEASLDPREEEFNIQAAFDDFEAELVATASRPQNEYVSSRPTSGGTESVLVSKYGLTVNTAAAASRSIFGSSTGPISTSSRPLSAMHTSARSSANIPISQVSSIDNINDPADHSTAASSPVESPYEEQNLDAHVPPPEGWKAQGKKRLIPIREVDWNQLAENEATELVQAYGALSLSYSKSVVPPTETFTSHGAIGTRQALEQDDEPKQDPSSLRLPNKQSMVNNWLNKQDFTDELLDFEAQEAAERQEQALRDELKLLREQEVAQQVRLQWIEYERKAEAARVEAEKQAEEERRATEELIRELEGAEKVRLAAALAEARARMRDCIVCGDSKSPFEFAVTSPTPLCAHPPQTCTECLQSWMASEFETKGCDDIKCPECSETLEHREVQAAASAETFAAYDNLAMRNALGSLEEFAWCLKAECGSGQMNIDNNAFMDCANCGYKQCLTHKVPWHTGETCAQYEYRTSGQQQRDEERKTEAMLDSVSKKCPNVICGWRIQKTDGCEHMTCKKCKHEFCWLCLCAQSEIRRIGNTAHKEDCKFHSDNIKVTWPFNAH